MDWEQFHRRSSLVGWHSQREDSSEVSWRPPYKCYQRFSHLELPSKVDVPAFGLDEVVHRRTSEREFRRIADLNTLGRVVRLAAGQHDRGRDPDFIRRPRRSYPSAGASYPLELYVLVQNSIGPLAPGVYHYCTLTDQIEVIDEEQPKPAIRAIFNQARLLDDAVIIVMTAVLGRIAPRYGDRGYRYALLEAGHVGQNVVLACAELELACCPLGGFLDQMLAKLLHLRSVEVPLYSIAFGDPPDDARTAR